MTLCAQVEKNEQPPPTGISMQQSTQHLIKNSLCHIFKCTYENCNLVYIQLYDEDGALGCDF